MTLKADIYARIIRIVTGPLSCLTVYKIARYLTPVLFHKLKLKKNITDTAITTPGCAGLTLRRNVVANNLAVYVEKMLEYLRETIAVCVSQRQHQCKITCFTDIEPVIEHKDLQQLP